MALMQADIAVVRDDGALMADESMGQLNEVTMGVWYQTLRCK